MPFTPPKQTSIEEEMIHAIYTIKDSTKRTREVERCMKNGANISLAVKPAIQVLDGFLLRFLIGEGAQYDPVEMMEVSLKTSSPTIKYYAGLKIKSMIKTAEEKGRIAEVNHLKAVLAHYDA